MTSIFDDPHSDVPTVCKHNLKKSQLVSITLDEMKQMQLAYLEYKQYPQKVNRSKLAREGITEMLKKANIDWPKSIDPNIVR